MSLVGFLAGMAADLDVLINSDADPLMFLEYHRQFTHSIIFMPIGALLASFALYGFVHSLLDFKEVYLSAFLGYMSHAPLDSCTSYGTQLFWPFSNYRVSWDFISIIDPLFTLPLIGLMVITLRTKKIKWARGAVLYAFFYLLVGAYQNNRAKTFAYELALERGHQPQILEVKPSIGNILLWKSIYEYQGNYYVDAIRIGLDKKIYGGESIPKLNLGRAFPWLKSEHLQYHDVQRFRWFSQGFVALDPSNQSIIGDVRYSLLPNEIDPLWGIKLSYKNKNQHTPFVSLRKISKKDREELWNMLLGR